MTGSPNIPTATYRLQFSENFTFQQARELVEYFNQLGISHYYVSPIFKAKPGSLHGYDLIDHSQLNPELGTEEDLQKLVSALREKKMGMILDIVPNHMFIMHSENQWWQDVLENGPASPYADFFDIDWHPPRHELVDKVLLPILDQQYGDALEKQSIKAIYDKGVFLVELNGAIKLPTDPKSWIILLESITKAAQTQLPEDNQFLLELKSIMTALSHLPETTEISGEKIEERQREKEVIRKRLENLLEQSDVTAKIFAQQLNQINGKVGDPRSFDQLEAFLTAQPYRLCFWRVANDEINFRRFFDIFDLAGIRTENPKVFEAVHKLIFELIHKKYIDGIRIDHIDGLWDPEQYLLELQACIVNGGQEKNRDSKNDRQIYTIAEKILTGNEVLPSEWAVDGTVGYDFMNQVNGLYVNQSNKKPLHEIYYNFTGMNVRPSELIYTCKNLILNVSMSSELFVLARRLDRISQQHRSSRDFTADTLRAALRDVIACFPVYRSYIRAYPEVIHEEDKQYILSAISRAKRLNPAIYAAIFDFIQSVLLLQHPPGLSEEQIVARKDFVMRFQQLTGPVTAKGLEDTAFYRFFPLASLREVGSDLYSFGITMDGFHHKNKERQETWPYSMTSTSTHDNKRSEDVRARINVLSELTQEWTNALLRWSQLNSVHKIKSDDEMVPSTNDEYLLYQTLIGSWPLYPMDPAAQVQYMKRIQLYMEKAVREAKLYSSWINPNKEYDQAMQQFIQQILNLNGEANQFLTDFKAFSPKVQAAGMLNSLSQILLKFTSPGIPDIYQGNEIWDFSLVDPDNRRPIDYANRLYLLKTIHDKKDLSSLDLCQQLLKTPEDGRIKLFITTHALHLRKKLPELFEKGSYVPLTAQGEKQNHIIAFARILDKKIIIVIATRFFIPLLQSDTGLGIDPGLWNDCSLTLPLEANGLRFKNIFTDVEHTTENINGQMTLKLSSISSPMPFALLESME